MTGPQKDFDGALEGGGGEPKHDLRHHSYKDKNECDPWGGDCIKERAEDPII